MVFDLDASIHHIRYYRMNARLIACLFLASGCVARSERSLARTESRSYPTTDGGDGDAVAAGEMLGGEGGLIDTGLVLRYFLNEAASGQSVSALLDSAPSPLSVSVAYDGPGNPEYIERATGRGLSWSAVGTDGRACTTLDGSDKIRQHLDGSVAATWEAVVDLQEGLTNYSRIGHIGWAGNWGFSFGYSGPAQTIRLGWRGDWGVDASLILGDWSVDLATLGRTVVTVLFDSTQADPAQRVRLYLDGSMQTRVAGTPPTLNQGLDLSQSTVFCLGNREIGTTSNRSPQGSIFYLALYDVALHATQIAAHANDLLASDD